jgi:hypothetical protein
MNHRPASEKRNATVAEITATRILFEEREGGRGHVNLVSKAGIELLTDNMLITSIEFVKRQNENVLALLSPQRQDDRHAHGETQGPTGGEHAAAKHREE